MAMLPEPAIIRSIIDRAERHALIHEPELAALDHVERRRRLVYQWLREYRAGRAQRVDRPQR